MGKSNQPQSSAKARVQKADGVKDRPTENTQVGVQRGRKPGKHSDVNYTQTSLYLPIELRNKVRSKLYEQGKEFSGLVEGMLQEWLSKQV
jgi:hypothetical protein